MKYFKLFKRATLILFILTITTMVAHTMVMPQATRCMLVDFYDFERDGDLYYRNGVSEEKKEKLQLLITEARKRVADFWGENRSQPKFIYCESDEDYKNFGSPLMTPAAAIMFLDAYIVISEDGINLDILSHELSHTELFERIGNLNKVLEIPVWFDEGLAMQVDHRAYYAHETLKEATDDLKNLPDITSFESGSDFYAGSSEQVHINYMTAKYEVGKWFTPETLQDFINEINKGTDFIAAYGRN